MSGAERVESAPAPGAPVLLYDGLCGFCNASVQFVLARDRRGTMRFAPLQSDYAAGVVARHPFLSSVDSVVLVEQNDCGERVRVRSDAAIAVASYLGGAWRLLSVFRLVPRPVRDFFYDAFARVRYRVFGKYDSCMIPPPEVRGRFIGT